MSRASRFDRGDFDARYESDAPPVSDRGAQLSEPQSMVSLSAPQTMRSRGAAWPIVRAQLLRVGDSVVQNRDGKGRPHKGVDLFASAGTEVYSATNGKVLRVVEGRNGQTASQRRAGLFVDVQGEDALVYRYLHLGDARVKPGQTVTQGTVLGLVAAPFTSGLRETPHLHFEIRQGDYSSVTRDYGRPVDPTRLLPPLRA